MKTRTTCLAGIIALTVFFAGTAFAGKTCEEQEAKEAERLATAAGKCEEKLLDRGCDPGACQAAVATGDSSGVTGWKGLVWEKKCDSACGGLHDVDNVYAWACTDGTTGADFGFCQPTQEASDACFDGATIDPSGLDADRTVGCRLCDRSSEYFNCRATTIWEWILAVNAEGLDGHNDWRIPDKDELASLLISPCPGSPNPCVDPVIGPTSNVYWTSTTWADDNGLNAWGVLFNDGSLNSGTKFFSDGVRAVRGGL